METTTRPVELRPATGLNREVLPDRFVLKAGVNQGNHCLLLTGEELQAIVQLAYDLQGILAEPSYTTEAERAPGACPCGLPGCSDVALPLGDLASKVTREALRPVPWMSGDLR